MIYIATLALLASCSSKNISERDLLNSINRTPMIYPVECVAQTSVVEESSPIGGLLGQRTAIIPVQANVKAGIDLSKLNKLHIEGNKVYITLPNPVIEIESTRILNDQIVTSVAPLRSDFTTEELTQIAQQGREAIEKKLYEYDLIEPAQAQAENIIAAIVKQVGLEAVFEQRPVYENDDLIKFVNPGR